MRQPVSGHQTITEWGNLPLSQVVVALDLDNTLLDPTGEAYTETTDAFLPLLESDLSLEEGREAYESLRRWGPALARIGLANPVHRRGHPETLAVFHLIFNNNPAVATDLGIDRSQQQVFRTVVEKADCLDRATRSDETETQLEAELRIRRFLQQDEQVARIRSEVRRVAEHPRILAWAEAHRSLERRLARGESGRLLTALASKGAIPIVVTKGYRDVQFDKLEQLGIRSMLIGRVLTTEAACDIPQLAMLDARLDQLMGAGCDSQGGRRDGELSFLWRYRRVINDWASKTPSFYGRCLHAIRESPRAPESAIARAEFLPDAIWRDRPLHFVMVGDRYDTDVEPIIDLLGPGAGMTIHLRMGKYRHDYPEAQLPPDRRATRTFADWESLGGFLTEALTIGRIGPIITPPAIVDRRGLTDADIERGLTSEFEAVRIIAQVAVAAP